MKNSWLIKNWNKRDFYKRELDATRRKLTRVQRQIDILEEQCKALDGMTEIFHPGNAALWVSTSGLHTRIHAAADDIGRWAYVYPNAQNHGVTFGVNINGWDDKGYRHLWQGGKWLGSDWPEIEALKAGKVWVARGRIVEREEAEIL